MNKASIYETLPVDGSNDMRRHVRQYKLFHFLPLHAERQQALNSTERQLTFPDIIATYHDIKPNNEKQFPLSSFKQTTQ